MRQLMSFFEGIGVKKFELGMRDMPRWRCWVLYELVDGEELTIVRNEGPRKPRDPRPEEDLSNLLPPGWVVKGPTCGDEDCDNCNPL